MSSKVDHFQLSLDSMKIRYEARRSKPKCPDNFFGKVGGSYPSPLAGDQFHNQADQQDKYFN